MFDNLELLYDEDHVQLAIKNMARYIINNTGEANLCFIMILKGGVYTGFKLMEALKKEARVKDLDIPYGFVGFSSYGECRKPNDIISTYDLDLSSSVLIGKDVWIVDDVFETGKTMIEAKEDVSLSCSQIYSLHTIALVNKCISSEVKYPIDWHGLSCDKDDFIVGCGLGDGEKYRSLDAIYKVKE